jgi:hypothetical protein
MSSATNPTTPHNTEGSGWVRCWEMEAHADAQCPAVLQALPLPLYSFLPADAHGGGLLESQARSWHGALLSLATAAP